MSAGEIGDVSVATYIEMFDETIRWSQGRGLPGDANRLRARLDALSKRVRDDEADRASAPGWAYRLEHRLVVDELLDSLPPELLDDLVRALRSGRTRGETDPGVWAALDRRSFAEDTKAHRMREALAEADVLMALGRHARRPSHVRLWEGIRALEEMHQARMALVPVFDVDTLMREGEHLAEALRDLLPPPATRLLSRRVEDRFRSQVEGTPVDRLGPSASFWHHKIPDLGPWYPSWQKLQYVRDRPDPFGTLFVSGMHTAEEGRRPRADAGDGNKAERRTREPAGHRVEVVCLAGQEDRGRGGLEVEVFYRPDLAWPRPACWPDAWRG